MAGFEVRPEGRKEGRRGRSQQMDDGQRRTDGRERGNKMAQWEGALRARAGGRAEMFRGDRNFALVRARVLLQARPLHGRNESYIQIE